MQTHTVNSIEKEIKHLQTMASERDKSSESTTELSSRITELTTLKEKISGAESLEDLKTIMSSYNMLPRMGAPMLHGEHGGYGGLWDHPPEMQDTCNS
jgi:hypothetical protein